MTPSLDWQLTFTHGILVEYGALPNSWSTVLSVLTKLLSPTKWLPLVALKNPALVARVLNMAWMTIWISNISVWGALASAKAGIIWWVLKSLKNIAR